MRGLRLVPLLTLTLACGRIGFDPLALNGCPDGDDTCTPPLPDAATVPTTLVPLCFAPQTSITPCDSAESRCQSPSPVSIVAKDLVGDSNLDLIVGDDAEGMVAVHPGRGDGSFGASTLYPVNWDAQEIAVEDLDGDGAPELIAMSWNGGGDVFRGVAGGTFMPATPIAGASLAVALRVADMDSDGRLDLVIAGEANEVEVLFGIGDASFAAPVSLINTENYYALAVGDLNNDDRLDIVASNGVDSLTILLHAPTTTEWVAEVIPAADGATGVVMGDWDSDGFMDLAIANAGAAQVELWLGDGTGTGFAKASIPVAPSPIWLTAADLNRDGRSDLVVTHADGGQVSTLLFWEGSFQPPVHHALSNDQSGSSIFSLAKSAVGDFNGDGIPDIATANPAGADVSLLLSAGPSACP